MDTPANPKAPSPEVVAPRFGAPRIAGICVFRNAGDLIGLVMLHHLRAVVDHIYCIDNGSTDGGSERVRRIARKSGRIDLTYDATARRKREYMTALARRAFREGYDIIVPFDSDELWDATRSSLQQAFCHGHNVVRCAVMNFIQRRDVQTPSALSWRHAIRRCAAVVMPDARVTDGSASFLELEFPSKVAFLGDSSVEVAGGQHSITRNEPQETSCSAIAVFHLPLRAKSELLKRAFDYEPRRVDFRVEPGDGWQGLYWRKRVTEGAAQIEWKALSYDKACCELTVNGRAVTTFVDRRLVAHLYRAAFSPLYGYEGLRNLWWSVPPMAEGRS